MLGIVDFNHRQKDNLLNLQNANMVPEVSHCNIVHRIF